MNVLAGQRAFSKGGGDEAFTGEHDGDAEGLDDGSADGRDDGDVVGSDEGSSKPS